MKRGHGRQSDSSGFFDVLTGDTKWVVNDFFQDYSGTLTTDGNLAFYGALDGWFRAVDENSGKIPYQFHAPSGIIRNPITYMHDGKQYVAVLSGAGPGGDRAR